MYFSFVLRQKKRYQKKLRLHFRSYSVAFSAKGQELATLKQPALLDAENTTYV